MCDFSTILAAIASAQGFLVAAIALTAVAIAANSSFFGAPGAPIPFGLGVASAGIAAASLAVASSALAAPGCSTGACAAEIAAARGAIDFLTATLTATAIVGAIAFATSAVPVVGAIAMGGYAAGLIIASVATGPATISVVDLQKCLETAASTAGSVLVVTGVIVSLVGIGFLLVVGGFGRNGGGGDDPDPFGDKGGNKPT